MKCAFIKKGQHCKSVFITQGQMPKIVFCNTETNKYFMTQVQMPQNLILPCSIMERIVTLFCSTCNITRTNLLSFIKNILVYNWAHDQNMLLSLWYIQTFYLFILLSLWYNQTFIIFNCCPCDITSYFIIFTCCPFDITQAFLVVLVI